MASALLNAVEEGDLCTVSSLLSKSGTRVNIINKHGESGLHIAAGYGRLDIVQALLRGGANINLTDKQGDSPLYWAARHGHLDVVKHLVEQGATVNNQDAAGETAVHVSARYGYPLVLSYLCQVGGADVDVHDKEGDTPLLCACWHGYDGVVERLLQAGASLSHANNECESPLHVAAVRGHYDIVKALCEHGAAMDRMDKDGRSALHYSAKRNHGNIVEYLCAGGACVNAQDANGDTALHDVCREGQLDTFKSLISAHCSVNLQNKNGAAPLHLAAKYGHAELVRELALQGADIQLVTEHGFHADEVAANFNHDDLASLLHQLRAAGVLEQYRRDLSLCKLPERVRLLLLGNSGVGKTELVESLKRGFLRGLFRPQVTTPTRGVAVISHTLPDAGPFSIWDFSGSEDNHILHECFVSAVNSVIMVVFSLSEPSQTQLTSIRYWLSLLKSLLSPSHTTHVLLVGTGQASTDLSTLYSMVVSEYEQWFTLELHTVDCKAVQSVRMLRRRLSTLRVKVSQAQPTTVPLVHTLLDHLSSWRCTDYPVLSLDDFLAKARSVNPLITLELSILIAMTLNNMGELICLDDCTLIVLDPNWLGTHILPSLLSTAHSLTGHLTLTHITRILPSLNPSALAQLCMHLHLCVPTKDSSVHIFPCLMRMEEVGVWERDQCFTRYAGVQLQCRTNADMFTAGLFPRIQSRAYEVLSGCCELSLWTDGLKVERDGVEALLCVLDPHKTFQLLVRGSQEATSQHCYSLYTQLYSVVTDTLHNVNPGAQYSTHVLSCVQVMDHCKHPSSYTAMELYRAQVTGSPLKHPTLPHCTESLSDLLWCGSLINADTALVRDLSPCVLTDLCALLDPPDIMGRDWCLLAVRLGLTEALPSIHRASSPTARLLHVWRGNVTCLVSTLVKLGRVDAVQVLIEGTSPFTKHTDC